MKYRLWLVFLGLLATAQMQEINWLEYPKKTALKIVCDTDGLPIYIDGIQVGVTPLGVPVEVSPGWHRVTYFPDVGNPYQSLLPKDRRILDIIRMGTVNILVEEGEIADVSLNYRAVSDEVRAYQRSVNSGRWIGFFMVTMVMVILAWVA